MLDELVARARQAGLRPWIAIKQLLVERVVEELADAGEGLVLQGGAALHLVHASPRLSADVDYAGLAVAEILEQRGEALARAATEVIGRPARWTIWRSGRLVRGKVTLEFDLARRLALPVEGYAVPAHHVRRHQRFGLVEEPAEIAADKVVATADRLRRRGTLKATDLFDLWHLWQVVGAAPPEPTLVARKVADYGGPAGGVDVVSAVRAVSSEELQAALEGILPVAELEALDAKTILERVAAELGRYEDAL